MPGNDEQSFWTGATEAFRKLAHHVRGEETLNDYELEEAADHVRAGILKAVEMDSNRPIKPELRDDLASVGYWALYFSLSKSKRIYEGSFSAVARRVARQCITGEYRYWGADRRGRGQRPLSMEGLGEMPTEAQPSPTRSRIHEELCQLVGAKQITDRQRAVLIAIAIDSMTVDTVATRLGLSRAIVRSEFESAKNALKAALTKSL